MMQLAALLLVGGRSEHLFVFGYGQVMMWVFSAVKVFSWSLLIGNRSPYHFCQGNFLHLDRELCPLSCLMYTSLKQSYKYRC